MRTIAYWLSLLMIFMVPWEHIVYFPGLGTASRLMGMLVLGVWIMSVLKSGRFRKFTPFHLLALVFFIWNAVSIFWSLDINPTMTRTYTYLRMAGLMIVLWDLFDNKNAVRAGLQAFLLGSFVPVLNLINNFITGSRSGYIRYSISGNNFNTSAIIMAFVIPIAFYLAATAGSDTKAKILRFVNYAYVPAALFGIALTATRFALIMAVPAIIYGLWTFSNLKPATRIIIFIVLFASLYQLTTIIPDTLIGRLATIGQEINGGDLNGRLEYWTGAFQLWIDRPFLGIGSAAFRKAIIPIYGQPVYVHNSFIAVLTETGIIGLMLFGSLIAMVTYYALRLPKMESGFWITMIIVWALGNSAITWTYTKSTWLFFSFLIAFVYLPEFWVSSKSRVISTDPIQVPNN